MDMRKVKMDMMKVKLDLRQATLQALSQNKSDFNPSSNRSVAAPCLYNVNLFVQKHVSDPPVQSVHATILGKKVRWVSQHISWQNIQNGTLVELLASACIQSQLLQYNTIMEIVNTCRALSGRRMEKLDKKVTWSENLTDVKIMTPQPSVFHNLREIVFFEEDEETLTKDTCEYKLDAKKMFL